MNLRPEWPTLGLFFVTYALWVAATLWLSDASLPLAIAATGVLIALHASLQHEATHGHPFSGRRWNTAVAFLPLTLVVPYFRFRDTHLDHHRNSHLTDPYDDPESNFLDPERWARLPRAARGFLAINNTLAGRILVGPLIGTTMFLVSEIRNLRRDPRVVRGWLWHVPMLVPVLAWVIWTPMPLWAYCVSAYVGLSLLRIRTFLEHRAHAQSRARSVIIEDRGPLALLFLNNNLHVVHHMHPQVPWYRLPGLYRRDAARFSRLNDGYVYRSYGEVFRRYLFRRKDPVPHPLWRGRAG
ncbi:MAG: fatty acid desaturase [Silicimonas sp.]|nr:fatty acid desaturase [Silicimonas sp.]